MANRNGVQALAEAYGNFAVIEDDPVRKAVAGSTGKFVQSAKVCFRYRARRLDFHPGNGFRAALQDNIHFCTVLVPEMVRAPFLATASSKLM